MRVLVVEDELRMARLLKQGLSEEGHLVTLASSGTEALEMAQSFSFDIVVLDVMLPGLDGINVVRRLRGRQDHVPILMLTARDTTGDVVMGLDVGADDYLTKPFSFDVLLARMRALERRGPISHPVISSVGDLTLASASREVSRGSRPIGLTRKEFSILEVLMKNAGRVVTRESLIERVWGNDSEIESNTLDAFVRLLRAKVEFPGEVKLIHTVRGVGYCLKVGDSLP
jgi:DNA-binding response OmpR family regulator